MEELKARQTIPDSWAEKALCVLCGYKPLTIERKGGDPDEMKCPRCGLSIVLDESGQYACISCLPKALQMASSTKWMKIPELVNYLKTAYNSRLKPEPSPFKDFDLEKVAAIPNDSSFTESIPENSGQSASSENPEELIFKIQALYDLGNPTWKIRQILKDSTKLTDEQIASALKEVEKQEKSKANRGTLKLIALLAVFLMVCGLLVGAFFAVQSIFAPNIKQANKMAETVSNGVSKARTENPPAVPAQVLTFAPPGVKIIDVPTPYVIRQPGSPGGSTNQATSVPGSVSISTGTRRTACPQYSKDAAALFGGNEKNWSLQKEQWVMLDNNGATINLPEGMTGGYLVVSSGMEIKSILGPAQIGNIYMIMISCK